ALGQRESSNNYQSENSAGFIGRYQFGEPALDDAGYYNSRNGAPGNSWERENWRGKNGADSKETFLNTPEIQDRAILDWFNRINGYLDFYKLKKADAIADFEVGVDIIGLANNLLLDQLIFEPVNLQLDAGLATPSTAIRLDNDYLAIVQGVVDANVFATNANFVAV
ncbi:MAG: hypothetical protein F6K24_55310, partial [Okeania sp. SIO2D1]|nr:hypothetical protein [Okeania sp. SIO2D1]